MQSQLSWREDGVSAIRAKHYGDIRASLEALIAALETMVQSDALREAAAGEIVRIYGRAQDCLWTMRTAVRAAESLNSLDAAALQAESDITLLAHRLDAAFEPVRHLIEAQAPAGKTTEGAAWRRWFAEHPCETGSRVLAKDGGFTAGVMLPLKSLHRHLTALMRISVPTKDGLMVSQTFSQAVASLKTSSDNVLTEAVFREMSGWFARESAVFADLLNAVLGFRLSCARSVREDILSYALRMDRMSPEVMEAMHAALAEKAGELRAALTDRFKAAGPVPVCALYTQAGDDSEQNRRLFTARESIEEAARAMHTVVPGFSAFIDEALRNRWIDAATGAAKTGGAWCDNLPSENAVFISLKNAPGPGVLFQASHLLGVGYLHRLLHTKTPAERRVPLSVIEIAGQFFETAVERTLAVETGGAFRAQAVRRLINMTLLLPMRHRLNVRLLRAREKGIVAPAEINQMTREAWEESFGKAVAGCDQYIWAYKQHFYRTDIVFYDWQYTLGYLASQLLWQAVMQKAPSERGAFVDTVLAESSVLSVEELIRKASGRDARDKQTWLAALNAALEA